MEYTAQQQKKEKNNNNKAYGALHIVKKSDAANPCISKPFMYCTFEIEVA